MFHDLKLSIKRPNKDTCQMCDRLKMSISMSKTHAEKIKFEEELFKHQTLADNAYKS